MSSLAVAALLVAIAAPALSGKTPSPSRPKKVSPFGALSADYLRAFLERFPVVATYLGAAGLDPAFAALDGKLRDYSPAALHAERDAWAGFQARLAKIDRKGLLESERIDATVLEAQLAFLLRNLDRRIHEKALDVFLSEGLRGVEWTLQGMTPGAAEARGTPAEWRSVALRTAALPAYLRTALANVRRGASGNSIPDRRLIRSAVEATETTAVYFEKSLPEKAALWHAGADTMSALRVGCPAAAAALREMRKGLLELFYEADGVTLKAAFDKDRFAIGETEYAWALRNNLRVTRTPREVHADGKAAVAATLSGMTTLAARIAADRNLADPSPSAVLHALSSQGPASDEEMLAWYREASRRLVAYGRRTAMFDLPDSYALDVVFTPAPLRDTIDAAYYPAPPFRTDGVGQFYVSPTGNDPAALREHARDAVASLAAHEGFPGHDWYFKFARAHAAQIPAIRWLTPGGVEDSASMWEDSMSSEGWALYCEQLVGEPRADAPEGFYSAAERLFQLQNALFRDARLVVDTGIHCGFMSFDEAVIYLARNVFFVKGVVSTDAAANPDAVERAAVAGARRQIFRYSKWPTQALTYALGKAEILSLRAACREIEGPGFSERRFHEEFLSEGQIPPALFRARLLARARARVTAATGAPDATSVGIGR